MKTHFCIFFLLLLMTVAANAIGLQLNCSEGLSIFVNSTFVIINNGQEKTCPVQPTVESESIASTIIKYCFIIGTSAVLGHYLIESYLAESEKMSEPVPMPRTVFFGTGVEQDTDVKLLHYFNAEGNCYHDYTEIGECVV